MQHAHLAGNASANVTPIDDNAALALVLDPSIQPEDLAPRMGLSLTQLAAWARDHATQLADLKDFFTTRATLIASRLHMSSLAALERVLTLAKDPDPKTQERSRKAASTILRNLAPPSPRASKPCSPTASSPTTCSPTVKEGVPGSHARATQHTSGPSSTQPPSFSPRQAGRSVIDKVDDDAGPSNRAPHERLAGPTPTAATPRPTAIINNADAPAARLRASVGSAPAVHLPCIRTALVLATFAVRELLLPTPPHRIPA